MARYIYQVHIADGFADDCEELVHRCSQHETLTYQQFTEIWKDMNMASIYQGRSIGSEIAELSEEVLHIAKRYMIANTSNFEESVAGLFLVYGLLHTQPFRGFAALRLVPDDVPAVSRIELVARRDRRLDVLFVLGSVLAAGPVQCHAENREFGFDLSLRKYLEGYTGIDRLGVRPRGVFYRQNEELDIIRDLAGITRLYEDAKASITDELGRRDPNLTYADKELPAHLEHSLKRIINGLTDDREDSPTNDRIDRIRNIKARAMKNTIAPIKHLTTVEQKKASTSTTASPRKKSDIVSKGGRLKTASPRTPVTTGSPRKPKNTKKKKPKPSKKKTRRKKKRDLPSSDSDSTIVLSDFDDDDDDVEIEMDDNDTIDTWIAKHKDNNDMNVKLCRTAPVEVEEINKIGPNIDELVEKEYEVHIDTVPIIIKGTTSQDFEIEFIDHYDNSADKSESKKVNKAKKKPVKSTKAVSETANSAGTSNTTIESNSGLEVSESFQKHYKLRRLEKRELKKSALKSKFKKQGLEKLVIAKESNGSATSKELE